MTACQHERSEGWQFTAQIQSREGVAYYLQTKLVIKISHLFANNIDFNNFRQIFRCTQFVCLHLLFDKNPVIKNFGITLERGKN